jgi:hypothetical protein
MVKSELDQLGLHYGVIELGEVEIIEDLSEVQRQALKKSLLRSGLELMDDKKNMLIEKIINVIVEMVHYTDEAPKINFSNFQCQE